MPYCPKCDMEFVEGVTVCSDCGGPLLASAEEAKALKADRQRELDEKRREELERIMAAKAAEEQTRAAGPASAAAASAARSGIYVDRRQKYEDVKSSASAFFIVGGILTAVGVLCWANLIRLPLAPSGRILFQTVLTAMGVISLLVAVKSAQSARSMVSSVAEEKRRTDELIGWFCSSFTAQSLDQEITAEEPGLSGEEMALRRFDLIRDRLITGRDLPDAAYAEALCEEIYGKLYEEA